MVVKVCGSVEPSDLVHYLGDVALQIRTFSSSRDVFIFNPMVIRVNDDGPW